MPNKPEIEIDTLEEVDVKQKVSQSFLVTTAVISLLAVIVVVIVTILKP
ncbi:hypothetical protein ACFL0L_04135 [Patescibacteria group bacterium]